MQNPAGLAVGGLIEQEGITYVVLPGPPSELKAMFTTSLLPLLGNSHSQLYSRVLRFFGIGESQLVTILADLIDNQTNPTLAPYAKVGEVTLRLSTKATCQEEADQVLDRLETQILQRDKLAEYFYAYGEENSLVKLVATSLAGKEQTLAVWEQGTGGLLQAELSLALAEQPYFIGGRVVGQKGAASGNLSVQASGIRDDLQADLGLAMSVFIKPSSTVDNVLAKVSLALSSPSGVIQKELDLGGYSWQHIRQLACLQALDFVRNTL